MTVLPAPDSSAYQPTSYYLWGQGQPQEHCVGTSCDNLVGMGAQQEQATAAAALRQLQPQQQAQQPPSPFGTVKPRRSDPAPAASPANSACSAGTSPRTAGGLDQFAPMLASNPVQQLPLMPAAASLPSADMVRVAAWLLGQAEAEQAPSTFSRGSRRGASSSVANDLAARSTRNSFDQGPWEGGETEGDGWSPDCEGYRATSYYGEASRRSLDSVVRPPRAEDQLQGDALNNFVAALY